MQKIDSNILEQERTLLDAERTFSAWIRTALGAMAAGVGIVRFISFKSKFHSTMSEVIGVMLMLWAIIIVIFAVLDYHDTQKKLTGIKNYKGSKWGFILIVLPLLIMSGMLVWITLQ